MEGPDEQLMLAYRDGDAAAFETLYARHRARLYRFVLRSVKSRAIGEELFQEIWMRVIEARARYTPQARFTTWLYTIAHNHLVDHWRKRGLTLVSLEGDETPGASPDPADHAAARESLSRFAAALEADVEFRRGFGKGALLQIGSAQVEVAKPGIRQRLRRANFFNRFARLLFCQ